MSNFFASTIERMLFKPAVVTAVEHVGKHFRLVSVQGEALQGTAWIPGQTSQFLVGSLTKRAYTPIDVDSQAGSARFLFFCHGQGPGSEWASALRKGDVCKAMRPKNSLDFTRTKGAALLFGDETSFAAARALQECQGGEGPVHMLFEVDSLADSAAALASLKLESATLVQKTENGSHLLQIAGELQRLAARLTTPAWFFTGCAPSIQVLRQQLKLAGLSMKPSEVRAYWAPGKRGMD